MSKKIPTLEANWVVSRWNGKGCCGEILDADRRLAPNGEVLSEQIALMVHDQLANAWPGLLSAQPLEKLPVKLVLNIVIERKDFLSYGK